MTDTLYKKRNDEYETSSTNDGHDSDSDLASSASHTHNSSNGDDDDDGDDGNAAKTPMKQEAQHSKLLMIIAALVVFCIVALALVWYSFDSTTQAAAGSGLPVDGDATLSDTLSDTSTLDDGASTTTSRPTASTDASPDPTPTRTSTSKPQQSRPTASSSKASTSASKTSTSSKTSSGQNAPSQTSDSTNSPTNQPSSGGPRASCKKGIGYNDVNFANALGVCWAYNWASSSGGTLASGVQYWPMLWGQKSVNGWTAAAESAIASGATVVLGFNELDLKEQANLKSDEAVKLWKEQIQPLKRDGVILVSPAVTNGVETEDGQPMGVPWLKQFISACSGCTIDAVALHWYDSAKNDAYFRTYFANAHAELKLPIYITEFMGTGDPADQKTFLATVIPWLEAKEQDYIAYYAAFGAFSNSPVANFFDSSGSLNELGLTYKISPG